MNKITKYLLIFILGGSAYYMLEMTTRGHSHWTMAVTGGICVLLLFEICRRNPNMKLWKKALLGAITITLIEFDVGCVVNIWLGLDVWDYSDRAFNILGQVCLLFTFFWFLLCIPAMGVLTKLTKKQNQH